MRSPNLGTAFYSPSEPPNDLDGMQRYLREETQRIAAAIAALAAGHLDKTYAAPAKPRDGDLRYADGTTWNPGSGAGVYIFKGSAWAFLG